MEDKQLNEQESLELIVRMIQNSKRNVSENAGGPALIWGYATILTSLLVYAGWMLTHQYYVMYGWFLIPVFGGIGTFLFGRGEKPILKKTYLDCVIRYIWLVMGTVCCALSVAAFIFHFPILFFISLLMATAITLTGCVTNYNIFTYFGIAGIALSFICLIVKGPEQILLFAGIFIVMMIIPGHILNAAIKKGLV